MKRIGLLVALVLVVLANVIVLAGVRYNRSGEPDAVVTLTERELHLQTNNTENSGVSLKLEIHPDFNKWNAASPWFDRKKLEEIGFDCSIPPEAKDASRRYNKVLPRRTYVVLEYEGRAWETWLSGQEARAKELETQAAKGREGEKTLASERKRYKWEKESCSRLFAVDVGNSAALLRQRYPDRTRYIITPALVRLRQLPADAAEKRQKPVLFGYVDEILTGSIHVPRDRQGLLTTLKPNEYYYYDGQKDTFSPRYKVMLKYGCRYEPWVAALVSK